jgi:hypothetical protein
MTNFRSLATAVLLGVSALTVAGAPAFAATAAPTTKVAAATHMTAKPANAAPAVTKSAMLPRATAAAKPAARPATRVAAAHSRGRMVTTKTSTGKTVTYDCSLAGNKTKQACHG